MTVGGRFGSASTLFIREPHIRIVVQLIMVIAWSNAGSVAHAGNTSIQTVTVDAAAAYSASGEDDLNRMRGYFQGASWESPVAPETWQQLQLLGISRFRLINVENQNCARLDESESKLRFDFSSLQPGLQDSRKYGVIPHIIVGQGLQQALSIHSGNHSYGVSNWHLYDDYAYSFVKYVTVEQGFSDAEFEVANEPDTDGAQWLLPEKHPFGDPQIYRAYIQLYRAWARAGKRVSAEYPDVKLRIGGPDITSFSLGPNQFNWAGQFIKDVAAMKLRLDFFSFHFYGNAGALTGFPAFGLYPTFDAQVDHFRNALKSVGLGNVPLYVTEWGPSYVVDESPAGEINGNNVGAAWTARFLIDMNAKKIEQALALTLRDHLDSKQQENNWGWPSFLLADGQTRKAMYNVALMFSKLPGRRVRSTPVTGSLGVLASADGGEIGILAFNQDWDFVNSKERAVNQGLKLRIQGLPFQSARVHVVRYVMDSTHGNAFYNYRQGLPIDRSRAGLSLVDDTTLPVSNGAVDVEPVNLEPSSLSFWEVTPTSIPHNFARSATHRRASR